MEGTNFLDVQSVTEYVQFVMEIREELVRLFQKQAEEPRGYYHPYYSFRFDRIISPNLYRWDGNDRPERRRYPWLIFQITTRGRGVFEWKGKKHQMMPGLAFCAYVPSRHKYYRPVDSEEWEFMWFSLQHVPRLTRLHDLLMLHSGVFSVDDAALLVRRTLDLMTLSLNEQIEDDLEEEWHATMWAFELERFLRSQVYPRKERHGLQNRLASFVRSGATSVTVGEAAKRFGMSRAHFSRVFKRGTGESPAAFLLKLRLRLVAERLHRSGDKLEVIAREAGFRDASELCRVFRRQYGVTPAVFRSQFALKSDEKLS